MTPTATRTPLPTLADALVAFRRTMREAAQPVDRGANAHTTAWTALPDTRAGKAALLALAAECGPRVTLRRPVRHLCYGPDCQLAGRVLGGLDPEWTLLNVEWACGRHDWLRADTLLLISPGTAWEAEQAQRAADDQALGAALQARLQGARS